LAFLLVAGFHVPVSARVLEGETSVVPWSGHWWPFQGGGLARGYGAWGHPAPLEKYELVTVGFYPWLATEWELAHHYNPDALDWEGLCYARAAAAAVEPEPVGPSVYRNVLFRVGDKKGLLTSLYTDPVTQIGAGSDPVRFHTWLLYYIGELDTPIAADMDPSEELWYYPIYKYRMDMNDAGSVRHVTCRVWYTVSTEADFQGAVVYTREYTYDLTVGPDGTITGGRWTGSSESNHPGLMFVVLGEGAENPHVDSETVHRIAATADDELEAEDPVSVGPGSYAMVLADREDSIRLPCGAGTPVHVRLESEGGKAHPLRVEGLDDGGGLLFLESVSHVWAYDGMCTGSEVVLYISRADDSDDPVIYTLTLESHDLHEYVIPLVLKNNAWTGFSVVNAGDEPVENVRLAGFSLDGEPVRTLWGPAVLKPGERKVFLLEDLIWAHERSQVDQLRLYAPAPLAFVNLFGRFGEYMAGFGPGGGEAERLRIAPETGYGTKWRVWTLRGDAGTVRLEFHGADGSEGDEEILEVSGSGLLHNGYDTDPNGWALVDADVPAGVVSYWENAALKRSEAVVNVSGSARDYRVPHLAVGGRWSTDLVIVNPGAESLSVTVRLRGPATDVSRNVAVAPHVKKTVGVSALFPEVAPAVANAGVLELHGSADFGGYAAYRTARSVAAVPFLEPSRASRVLVVPHVASTSYWWTGVALMNAGVGPASPVLEGYDAEGNLLERSVPAELKPGEKRAAAVRDLFSPESVEKMAWIRVESSEPLLGVMVYGGLLSSETAALPLSEMK
jgi:hypothetical protein